MIEQGAKIKKLGIILCECRGQISAKIDFAEISNWLMEKRPAVIVKISDNLCQKPTEISSFIESNNPTNVIVGACKKYRETFEEAATKSGLSFCCLRSVNILDHCVSVKSENEAEEKTKILLAAAISKTKASEDVTSENLTSDTRRLDGRMSRRAFLTFPIRGKQRIIPSIDQSLCMARRGCHLCTEACPKRALYIERQKVQIAASRCEPCGVCVSACPTNAVVFPLYSQAQIDEEIRALVSTNAGVLEPRIILFACSNVMSILESATKSLPFPPNILVVEVPCIGVIKPLSMVRTLELGADAVALTSCQEKCGYGYNLSNVSKDIETSNRILAALGLNTERIRLINVSSGNLQALLDQLNALNEDLKRLGSNRMRNREPAQLSNAGNSLLLLVKHLAKKSGVTNDLKVCNSNLPFWMIEIDAHNCSVCGLCANSCPTNALSLKQEEARVKLTFNYSLCVACDICVRCCPTKAISYENVLDLAKICADSITLIQDKLEKCETCGSFFSSQKQIELIVNRAGLKSEEYFLLLSKYCPNCRLSAHQKSIR